MPEMRFENQQVHPRVATMIKQMGWLFLHEYTCGKGRMDFLAMNPVNGDLAIVECKTSIPSVGPVLGQIGQYHHDFGIRAAFEWVFTWEKPKLKQIETIEACDVKLFLVNESIPATSPYLKSREKSQFYYHFYRFYPFHDYFPFRTEGGRAIHPYLIHLDWKERRTPSRYCDPRIYDAAE
jgi:hypothetical protein